MFQPSTIADARHAYNRYKAILRRDSRTLVAHRCPCGTIGKLLPDGPVSRCVQCVKALCEQAKRVVNDHD